MTDIVRAMVVVVDCVVGGVVGGVAVVGAFVMLTHALRASFDGGAPGLWRAALGEVAAFARVSAWAATARARRRVDDVHDGSDVVVVLVHGAMADGTCLTAWRRAVVARAPDVPVLQPDHGAVVEAVAVHAARVARFLRAVRGRVPQARLVLVGHSLGGVVIRRVLADDDDLRAATSAVVTVASPHAGTASVRWLRRLPFAAQLGEGHETVRSLPPLHELVDDSVVVGSAVDAIVYPPSTTQPPARERVLLADVGHAALLTREDVVDDIADRIVACILRARGVRDDVDDAAPTC